MGERIYEIEGKSVRFTEVDDIAGCLCTFPRNDQEELHIDRVVSLALFGAAVRLIHADEYTDRDTIIIPRDIPDWIQDGIFAVRRDVERLERLQQKIQELMS